MFNFCILFGKATSVQCLIFFPNISCCLYVISSRNYDFTMYVYMSRILKSVLLYLHIATAVFASHVEVWVFESLPRQIYMRRKTGRDNSIAKHSATGSSEMSIINGSRYHCRFGALNKPHCSKAVRVVYSWTYLKPLTGKGDVTIRVKNSRVWHKTSNKQTKKRHSNIK